MLLRDKVGIVTAAASGMGRAGAIRFAKEGAAVGVVDINAKGVEEVVAEIEKAGGRALALPGDLTDDGFSRDIVEKTVAAFGGLDFLWAHAGTPGPGNIERLTMAEFDFAVTLNVRTALITTVAAVPHMRKRGGGSVLYTASTSGLRGSPVSPVYSVVKFGIVGMARSLAKQYGKENIRFNAVCPGMIDTPMLPDFIRRPGDPPIPKEELDKIIAQRAAPIALGRKGTPEDVAGPALFLLSDESRFVTGVALPVDGGILA